MPTQSNGYYGTISPAIGVPPHRPLNGRYVNSTPLDLTGVLGTGARVACPAGQHALVEIGWVIARDRCMKDST
jgi:hypothetical protein